MSDFVIHRSIISETRPCILTRDGDILDTGTNITELLTPSSALDAAGLDVRNASPGVNSLQVNNLARSQELETRLRALRSFFDPRNHPLSETERANILTRDFANETRIAQEAMLRCSQLIFASTRPEPLNPFGEAQKEGARKNGGFFGEGNGEASEERIDRSVVALADALGDVYELCYGVLETGSVSFRTWSSLGRVLVREIERSAGVGQWALRFRQLGAANLPTSLLMLSERAAPGVVSTYLLITFIKLTQLLDVLRFIEASLRRDQPLKQMLPIFTLVYEESRALLDLIETRALRTDGFDGTVFDALDGAAYAISMELRKAFEHELIGLSAQRQAPLVYAKIESAHGVLRDCFQQSTVSLAQALDNSFDGAQLFQVFQTKLDQSLALRSDLWTLLQLVQRAEKERDRRPIASLLERLVAFREGSLRYLMYKDWESYERFLEEVSAAHGAIELAPVLHRFAAYLETLLGQINMRAILADHPFTYPTLE